MSRETDALEAGAEATRAEVSELINQVKSRIEPAHVVEEVMDYAREGLKGVMNHFARSISDGAQRNPIPFVLMGAGLAWLVVDQTRNHGRPHHIGGQNLSVRGADSMPRPQVSATNGGFGRTIDRAAETASDAMKGTRTALSGALEEAQSSVTEVANAGYRQARDLAREAGTTIDRASSNLHEFAEAQPLVLGAIGLAIGAALGAAIPLSAEEERLMGSTADEVKDAASRAASDGVEKVKAVAQHTYDRAAEAVREEASAQGLIDPSNTAQGGGEQKAGNGSLGQQR